jgi:hypothetical protein
MMNRMVGVVEAKLPGDRKRHKGLEPVTGNHRAENPPQQTHYQHSACGRHQQAGLVLRICVVHAIKKENEIFARDTARIEMEKEPVRNMFH